MSTSKLVWLCAVSASVTCAGQESATPRPYDGIQAGQDAYQIAEAQRQANVAQQAMLNDQLQYWSGVPRYYAARPLSSAYTIPLLPPANREFAYAYGVPRWPRPLTVFEPWPVVAGDLYGYGNYSFLPPPAPLVPLPAAPLPPMIKGRER